MKLPDLDLGELAEVIIACFVVFIALVIFSVGFGLGAWIL